MTTDKRGQHPAAVATAASAAAMGGGDVYALCRTGSSAAGRGSIAGWTPCPLCSPTNNLLMLADFSISNGCDLTLTTTTTDNNNDNNSKEDGASNIISSLPTKTPQYPPPTKSNTKSIKLFSHGRGLSAHLHAVHTPWNPGKAELKRRENLIKRMENEARRQRNNHNKNSSSSNDISNSSNNSKKRRHCEIDVDDNSIGTCQISIPMRVKWEPTEVEIKQWNQRVVDIVSLVESTSKKRDNLQHLDQEEGDFSIDARDVCSSSNNRTKTSSANEQPSSDKFTTNNITIDTKGRDRSGNICLSYRNSLPPFLAAAADGDLLALMRCMNGDGDDSVATAAIQSQHSDSSLINNKQYPQLLRTDSKRREQIKKLLSIRDRNGSTAEHWAAGGGHLDCVVYLLDMRDFIASGASEPTNISTSEGIVAPQNTETSSTNYANKKIRRRRDGKTSLHYAARNGHIDIIDLLLSRQRQEEEDAPLHADISSGDGTTPLHLACYGGHREAVQHLIEIHSANIHACNEWECSSAHWAAMSLGAEGAEKVIELCIYLKQRGANFVQRQKQGHTPLHKAASRKNRHVIEWLATSSLFSEEERKAMGAKDVGGNCPSDVWLSVGGEEEFGLWMKEKWNW